MTDNELTLGVMLVLMGLLALVIVIRIRAAGR